MHKVLTNIEVAELLRSVAAAYQLKDEAKNRFRIIAYERAADAVEHATSELKDLWDEDKLDEVPGIGESIAGHLGELFKTGSSSHFNEVMRGLPPQMFELMVIPGIGAKTAFKLSNQFKSLIKQNTAIQDLEKIARAGKIAKLEGFGEESEKDIIRSISEVKGRSKRLLLPYAAETAGEIIDWLKKNKNVAQAEPLGSLRRKAATVGDIDIAVATDKVKEVIEHFVKYPHAKRVLEKGGVTASLVLPSDVQVDLMVQSPESFGSLLQHFTGSKHHNITLREYSRSLSSSLSLSEYGIKKVGTAKIMKFKTEEEFYNYLKLDWIPPELREDTGEIKSALNHKLPELIEPKDIKADLQIHSSFDIETSHDLGASSLQEIVENANRLDYEYLAFTEHNPSHSRHSKDQIINILRRKKVAVDKINNSLSSNVSVKVSGSVKRVFNSLEIDILPDGKLPVPAEGLETLDFALVSVHSSFRLSKAKMTTRVISALSQPKVRIFAHPSARLLGKREGIDLDWEKVFEFCAINDKWVEINADPMRLDLPDNLVKMAISMGVKLSMGTDAHHFEHMQNMPYAVYVARRGWAEKKDIVNTRSLLEFEKLLSD